MSQFAGWAQIELRRQRVQDLTIMIVAIDGLVDYKMGISSSTFLKGTDHVKTNRRDKSKRIEDPVSKLVEGTIRTTWETSRLVGCFICNDPY